MKTAYYSVFLFLVFLFSINTSFSQTCTPLPNEEYDGLIALYSNTNGESWTNRHHWTYGAYNYCDWYGVGYALAFNPNVDTHVESLSLSNNNLVGSIPVTFIGFDRLEIIDLSNNYLSGPIPNIPTLFNNGGSLLNLQIQNNNFIFSDLEQIVYYYGEDPYAILNYSPQRKVDQEETINLTEGSSYILTTRLNSINNSYQWYKDGVVISGATSKDYTINSLALTDAGVYHVIATNSIVTGLTLQRNDITLNIIANACSVPTSERDALMALYNSTNGANWTNTLANNQAWDINISVCDWYGVTVTNGSVASINLSENNLNGTIPASLGNLTNLNSLDLYLNNLTGALPSSIGSLINLQTLILSNNQLTSIPSSIGNLQNLNTLYASDNQFSGNIPSELGTLTNLVELSLHFNQFTGSIPASFSGLTGLYFMHLNDNQLSGAFPSGLTTLNNLVGFKFHNNKFVFKDFETEHTTLQTNISNFYVYSPQAKVDQIETSTVIEGSSYTLTTSLSSTNNSYQWYKDGVAITGATSKDYTINSVASTDAGVYYVTATNSIITGLTLQRNDITLNTTVNSCTVPTSERDALMALYNSTNGANWTNTLANNQAWDINISVCDWYGVTVTNGSVASIVLENNNLNGTIPASLSNLTNLDYLNLYMNNLTGAIPSSIGDLFNLTDLRLSNNQLTSIPSSIGNLQNLNTFYASDNQFSGNIPSELGTLTNLVELSLHFNQFTGSIPASFSGLTGLYLMHLNDNQLSGVFPPGVSTLSNFVGFKFHNNKFVFKDFENEHAALTNILTWFYVYSPQAKVDEEETVNLTEGSSYTLTTSLSSTNNSYQWYKDGVAITGATSKDYTINSVASTDAGVYYVTATNSIVTGLTLERNTITIVVNPTTITSNIFCLSEWENYPIISNLTPSGGNILWYETATGGTAYSNTDEIKEEVENSGGVSYWWDDTTDGVTTRTETIVTTYPLPEGDTEQLFSIYAPVLTISDIDVANSGNPIYWYATSSSATQLAIETGLVDGQTYYASFCNTTDEACFCRLPVTITIGVLPPQGALVQYLCEGAILNDIIVQSENNNLSVIWYDSETNGTVLNGTTPIISENTYYATQKDNSNGIESQSRLAVLVFLSTTPPPTVNQTDQYFYANQSQTVGDLKAFGNDIKWYSQAEGGNVYANTTALVDGTTYYAEQNGNNTCPSTSRVAVTAHLSTVVPDPLLGCELFRPELLQHYVIDAWLNEREVTTEVINEVSFNDSEESELFVDLLNHLKNRLLSADKSLHDIPNPYEPVFMPGEPQIDLGRLMPYIEGLTVSEKKLTVYDFKTINDNYFAVDKGRTIGFSFYLNAGKTKQFIYKTPKVVRNNIQQTEHYPLLDHIGNTSNEFLNFTKVEVNPSNQFVIYSSFNQVTAPAHQENQVGELSSLGAIKESSTSYKYNEVAYQAMSYTSAKIEVSFVNVNNEPIGDPIVLQPQGSIIDKWQKVSADFVIPNDAGKMIIALKNEDTSRISYFDDVRIHPFDSNMKTFVYHPETQRLMSELDENNYATFYEYDLEGGLVRVKKETEKGIYTIQETRSGNVKASN